MNVLEQILKSKKFYIVLRDKDIMKKIHEVGIFKNMYCNFLQEPLMDYKMIPK